MDTVFIPSKGRASNCQTHRNLEAFDIHNWLYLVEPDDYWNYIHRLRDDGVYAPESHVYAFDVERFKSPLSPEHPDGYDYCDPYGWKPGLTTGPGPARNAMHQLALDMGLKHYWMMDDDIVNFAVDCFFFQKSVWTKDVQDGGIKKRRISLNDFFELYERFLDKFSNIGMAELDKQGLAQNYRKNVHFAVNSKAYTCIRFGTEGPRIPWRSRFNDDVMASLDHEKRGMVNVSCKMISYQTPDTQSQAGGMTEAFKQEGTLRKVRYLVKQYPEVSFATLKYERIHHLVHYAKFTQEMVRKPGVEDVRDLTTDSWDPYGTFHDYYKGITPEDELDARWKNVDDLLMAEYIGEQRAKYGSFADGKKLIVNMRDVDAADIEGRLGLKRKTPEVGKTTNGRRRKNGKEED